MLNDTLSFFIFLGLGSLAGAVATAALVLFLWYQENQSGDLHFATDWYIYIAILFVVVFVLLSALKLRKAQKSLHRFNRTGKDFVYEESMKHMNTFWRYQGILRFAYIVHLTLLAIGFSHTKFW